MKWKIAEDKGSNQKFLIAWELNSTWECWDKVVNDMSVRNALSEMGVHALDPQNMLSAENDDGKHHVFYFLN